MTKQQNDELYSKLRAIMVKNDEDSGYLDIFDWGNNKIQLKLDGSFSIKTLQEMINAVNEVTTQQEESKLTMPELIAENEEELKLHSCPQCGEDAYDKYICHNCGFKII